MKEVILFGGGGHGFASLELINSSGEYRPVLVYDDHPKGETILRVPLKKYAGDNLSGKNLCIGIGNNLVRKQKATLFSNAHFPTFIHHAAVCYPSASIGKGCQILPNSVVDAACRVGDFCIVNNNATISHNAVLENFVHVAINVAIAGGVHIGEGTLVGAGSSILPEVTIGKWATIGAGAVVTKPVPDYAVVYGNPAKIIKYNPPHEI